MLTIRKAQMEAFQSSQLDQNLLKMSAEFVFRHAERARELGPEASDAFVRAAVAKSVAWGITKFDDVWTVVGWMVKFGLDFANTAQRPWALPILDSETLSGSAKVKLMAENLK